MKSSARLFALICTAFLVPQGSCLLTSVPASYHARFLAAASARAPEMPGTVIASQPREARRVALPSEAADMLLPQPLDSENAADPSHSRSKAARGEGYPVLSLGPEARLHLPSRLARKSPDAFGAAVLQGTEPAAALQPAGYGTASGTQEPVWLLLLGSCLLGSAAVLFQKMKT